MWWLVSMALAAPITADEVVALALARSPELAAAEGAVEAARGDRAASLGLRSNPNVDLQVGSDGHLHELAVAQPISLSGEGLADARAARSGRDAAASGLERARLEVAAQARRELVEAVVADAALRVAREQLAVTTRLRQAAEARAAAGEAAELDAQLARLEQAGAAGRLVEASLRAFDARSALADSAGLSRDTELPDDPLDAAPAPAGGGARADVAAAESAYDAAKAALARERSAAVPEVAVGVFLNDGEVGSSVAVELPLWHRNDAGRGQARAGLVQAEATRDATRARAENEASGAAGLLDASAAAAEVLGQGVSDDATAALVAVERAYAVGELGMIEVGVLQARVIEGQRGWYEGRAAAAAARIQALLATGDPALLGRGAP